MSPLFTYNGKLLQKDGKLANNQDCCCSQCCYPDPCCVQEQFSTPVTDQGIGACTADVYGERTINKPECFGNEAALVTIYGVVDDELIVDGVITEPGLYPFSGGCNGAHLIGGPTNDESKPFFPGSGRSQGISFVLNQNSFTIAAGDNHGFATGYDLIICFSQP